MILAQIPDLCHGVNLILEKSFCSILMKVPPKFQVFVEVFEKKTSVVKMSTVGNRWSFFDHPEPKLGKKNDFFGFT